MRSDKKLMRLLDGDITNYDSPSEADLACVSLLRQYTRDREQVKRLWLTSALGRKKHDRADYVEATLNKAFFTQDDDEELFRERLAYRQADRRARLQVDAEAASEGFHEPPTTFDGADELAIVDPPKRYTVEGLLQHGHNADLSAQYKVGKTVLNLNLARSLADNEPFLDALKVDLGGGRVAIWNYEMDAAQFREWLRVLDIRHPENIALLHLRGERVPLISDVAAEWTVKWLREREIAVWLLDPWSGLLRHSMLKENDNDEAGRMTDRLDLIRKEAGLHSLVVSTHTGRSREEVDQERARGATRLDDWVDARWVMVRESGTRLLKAEGRGIDMPYSKLVYDPDSRRLTLGKQLEGGRREYRREQHEKELNLLVETIRMQVKNHPGIGKRELRQACRPMRNEDVDEVVNRAIERGRIVNRPKGPAHHYFLPDKVKS